MCSVWRRRRDKTNFSSKYFVFFSFKYLILKMLHQIQFAMLHVHVQETRYTYWAPFMVMIVRVNSFHGYQFHRYNMFLSFKNSLNEFYIIFSIDSSWTLRWKSQQWFLSRLQEVQTTCTHKKATCLGRSTSLNQRLTIPTRAKSPWPVSTLSWSKPMVSPRSMRPRSYWTKLTVALQTPSSLDCRPYVCKI